jgi:hypothetical protein
LFFEYFDGDNGAGIGASRQMGWAGTDTLLIHLVATVSPDRVLEGGKMAHFERVAQPEIPACRVGQGVRSA